MTAIEPSNRCPLRYRMHNGVTVAVSQHAAKRAGERGIDIEARLSQLHGIALRKYKDRGVVAKYNPYHKLMKIITVW